MSTNGERRMRWTIATFPWLLAGCVASGAPADRRSTPPQPVTTAPTSRSAQPTPSAAPVEPPARRATPAAPTDDPPDRRTSQPLLRLADIRRVVAEPVHSLALDPDRGKVAALGRQPWLDDGSGWQRIELPASLMAGPGERDRARIYFGRDHQPRIMGARIDADGPRQLYLRYRLDSWRAEEREQAAFAGKPHAALYGVLGWEDPEVLCKVGAFCLVKQRSGWSRAPLPVEPPHTALRVDLGTGGAYALLEHQLLRLGKERWIPVGKRGPWQGSPGGAWLLERGGWVSAPAEDALYEHDGARWQRRASPVTEPRGLWSRDGVELWVAGRDGLGYFDGRTFYRVAEISGPVSVLTGLDDRLWLGGGGGVWSARRSAGADATDRTPDVDM